MQPPPPVNALIKLGSMPWRAIRKTALLHPYFRFVRETAETQTAISFNDWAIQNIFGINKGPYWPVHPTSRVVLWRNILAGIETSPGQMPGCYIQGVGRIYVGDYTQIGPSVGIISANHRSEDNRAHIEEEVRIGAYCWLGMGSVILPRVTLGDFTVVAAGAVVSRSFPEGHCVVAGSPAKIVKRLDPDKCVRHRSTHEYHGYIPAAEFPAFRTKFLTL